MHDSMGGIDEDEEIIVTGRDILEENVKFPLVCRDIPRDESESIGAQPRHFDIKSINAILKTLLPCDEVGGVI